MNDSTVSATSIKKVLAQQAYILFYSKDLPSSLSSVGTKGEEASVISNDKTSVQSPVTTHEILKSSANREQPQTQVHDSMIRRSDDDAALTPKELKHIQIFGTDRPCRLKRLWAWHLKPFKFLGNVKRKFMSWKIPRSLPKLR